VASALTNPLRTGGSVVGVRRGCAVAAIGALFVTGVEAGAAGPDHRGGFHPIRIVGTPGPDVLRGTAALERILGLGGDDRIDGGAGDDVIRGGPGNDTIRGGRKRGQELVHDERGELLYGGSGNDMLIAAAAPCLPDEYEPDCLQESMVYGGGGRDRLLGSTSSEVLVGGPGRDVVVGGSGHDEILVRDGHRDTVSCGRGPDLVRADRLDRVHRACEDVRR
jgi:Ca2+-binding RTX toxin-like protein